MIKRGGYEKANYSLDNYRLLLNNNQEEAK
jgi:hypothetical protein